MSFYFVQFLTGLASAASLFLVASGLSIIFGVSRVVNFAHGSFYMLGAYIGYSLVIRLGNGPLGFWIGILAAAVAVGLIGGAIEIILLRRLYKSPELFQLVGTFGVVLVFQDLTLSIWGPDDLLAPRAPGLDGAISVFGHRLPEYDLALILLGPAVLIALWLLLKRTRWGILVRAATEDPEMAGALGVNRKWLLTGVFVLGSMLAGLGGALQLPREPANLLMDLNIIAEAFVVVVIGGMGSLPGAFLAAVLIGVLQAFGILIFPEIALVMIFLVMAVVLVVRPWGLLGRPELPPHVARSVGRPFRPVGQFWSRIGMAALCGLALLPMLGGTYAVQIATEIAIFALFAASLHFLMGIGGMISFGHAAYLGFGAYGSALLVHHLGAGMEVAILAAPLVAGLAAALFGWFCVRLSGVYLAMLTLAFAQISWSIVFQWYDFTGGDNGILGIWPAAWAANPYVFYWLTVAVCLAALVVLRRAVFSPFGFALRAARDSRPRAETVGINVKRLQWAAFTVAGAAAGLAGGLYAFLKGSVFPTIMAIPVSVDGLVMVLLGGVQTLIGPLVGAGVFTGLKIEIASETNYWRVILGMIIIFTVLAFPQGLVGFAKERFGRAET
ncbi:MAG: ABC transporter permease [Rhodospirillales bacterium]|nr:ABC transporter permease [Rhodospirillales bacterium]